MERVVSVQLSDALLELVISEARRTDNTVSEWLHDAAVDQLAARHVALPAEETPPQPPRRGRAAISSTKQVRG
jgi:hypothetical protein